jgi:O-antigen/teichoic acid export membrane protein
VPVAPTHPASRRERAIKLTVAAAAGAKGFSVLCTFVQVPLALRYLGTEAYGFWITLFSIMLVLNFVDFGLGVGMQHAMATAFGTDKPESMKRAFWSGATALAVLGLIILVAGTAAARIGSWADILHIRDPELRRETPAALTIAVAAFVLGLPFNAVARLAAAVQRGWIHAGWIAAGSALSLGFVAAAAFGHWGFLWFLAASLLVPTLQGVGLFIHLLRGLGWNLLPTSLAPVEELRGMLRSSLYFAFPQLGMALVQSIPAIAISMAAGASAVTGYNLLIRMFGPFQQGQQIMLNPIWPAYTEAHSRLDHPWVARTYWRTVAAFCVLAVAIAGVAWESHPLLRLWIGPNAVLVGRQLTALVAAWSILQMAAQPCIFYLMGVGRLRQLAWVATPGLLISSAALLIGSRGGTAEGVLGYGSLALAATLLPPLAWETGRAMKAHRANPRLA